MNPKPSPQVYFELLEQPDRIHGIARLLLRRNRLDPPVLIFCPDQGFMAQLDECLWTIHPESFLAHGLAGADAIANQQQPILLTTSMDVAHHASVLINGSLEVPPEISSFRHVVDFVDAWDPVLKQASRERFRTYRHMGLDPQYLGSKGS